jgi:hypothetical protein
MQPVLTRTAFLIVALTLANGSQVIVKQQEPPAKNLAVAGGMEVLPGYQHRRMSGFDTARGVVWKDAGPSIEYEFGEVANRAAAAYRAKGRATRTVTNGHSYDIVFDEAADVIVGTIGFFNFTATKVKTKADVADVLLMAMSFDYKKL